MGPRKRFLDRFRPPQLLGSVHRGSRNGRRAGLLLVHRQGRAGLRLSGSGLDDQYHRSGHHPTWLDRRFRARTAVERVRHPLQRISQCDGCELAAHLRFARRRVAGPDALSGGGQFDGQGSRPRWPVRTRDDHRTTDRRRSGHLPPGRDRRRDDAEVRPDVAWKPLRRVSPRCHAKALSKQLRHALATRLRRSLHASS